MPYSDRDYTVTNINYLNKDFSSLKSTLVEYAKTYFPNTYRDFNETSPGMMLIEMGAYVGDVLSFYIDQQYKEMLLPLAEERRNIINIAGMLGYKVKPTTPAYVTLKVTQDVSVTGDVNNLSPDYSGLTIDRKGLGITATSDSTIKFETLDDIDFSVSSSKYQPEVSETDDNGIVTSYKLTREVRAMSGETKTKTFTVGAPTKFLKLTLSDTNVIDITSVTDSNGNKWYEVDYLAQDKVPIETFYNVDDDRTTAYEMTDDSIGTVAIPYSLQYIKTAKKFIVEINEDDTTSLLFGNGVLRSGQIIGETEYLNTEQIGIVIPGEPTNLSDSIDPFAGDSTSTLGESPAHTTLTVSYRVGGGVSANVPSGDLTTHDSTNANLTVTNEKPARGGSGGETIEEIRRKSKSFFATQNRCVTQEDYEARILNMPAKFGNIAKVFVERVSPEELFGELDIDSNQSLSSDEFLTLFSGEGISTVSAYILSYDHNKNLVYAGDASVLYQNLKNYISHYRIITDEVSIFEGKIINFGVVFDVVSHRSANKQDVKLRCINKIIEYFNVDKMQFRQPIYTSDLEYELMGLDGVRSVNFVRLDQFDDATSDFGFDIGSVDVLWDSNSNGEASGDSHTGNYGWQYDFTQFYGADALAGNGTILPAIEPSVFELKNPNKNIVGIVR